jgi:hypothetical protein
MINKIRNIILFIITCNSLVGSAEEPSTKPFQGNTNFIRIGVIQAGNEQEELDETYIRVKEEESAIDCIEVIEKTIQIPEDLEDHIQEVGEIIANIDYEADYYTPAHCYHSVKTMDPQLDFSEDEITKLCQGTLIDGYDKCFIKDEAYDENDKSEEALSAYVKSIDCDASTTAECILLSASEGLNKSEVLEACSKEIPYSRQCMISYIKNINNKDKKKSTPKMDIAEIKNLCSSALGPDFQESIKCIQESEKKLNFLTDKQVVELCRSATNTFPIECFLSAGKVDNKIINEDLSTLCQKATTLSPLFCHKNLNNSGLTSKVKAQLCSQSSSEVGPRECASRIAPVVSSNFSSVEAFNEASSNHALKVISLCKRAKSDLPFECLFGLGDRIKDEGSSISFCNSIANLEDDNLKNKNKIRRHIQCVKDLLPLETNNSQESDLGLEDSVLNFCESGEIKDKRACLRAKSEIGFQKSIGLKLCDTAHPKALNNCIEELNSENSFIPQQDQLRICSSAKDEKKFPAVECYNSQGLTITHEERVTLCSRSTTDVPISCYHKARSSKMNNVEATELCSGVTDYNGLACFDHLVNAVDGSTRSIAPQICSNSSPTLAALCVKQAKYGITNWSDYNPEVLNQKILNLCGGI